jgi:hypothetical protein
MEARISSKVINDIFKVVLGTYILAQDLTCTCVLMLMRWCSHDGYGMVQCKKEMMQYRQLLVNLARMCYTRKQPLKDSLKAMIWQGF